MHLIWHMRESLIFAYVAQSHGGRELVECGAHPLSPHVIVPHGANMRGTFICHMRCIFLIYIYIYIEINAPHIAYEGIPHICICGIITWGERVSGMWGPPSLSPCDCAT